MRSAYINATISLDYVTIFKIMKMLKKRTLFNECYKTTKYSLNLK